MVNRRIYDVDPHAKPMNPCTGTWHRPTRQDAASTRGGQNFVSTVTPLARVTGSK
jgi:hypothetical protein